MLMPKSKMNFHFARMSRVEELLPSFCLFVKKSPQNPEHQENDEILFLVMEKIHGKDCQSFQVDLLLYRKGKTGLLLTIMFRVHGIRSPLRAPLCCVLCADSKSPCGKTIGSGS